MLLPVPCRHELTPDHLDHKPLGTVRESKRLELQQKYSEIRDRLRFDQGASFDIHTAKPVGFMALKNLRKGTRASSDILKDDEDIELDQKYWTGMFTYLINKTGLSAAPVDNPAENRACSCLVLLLSFRER